MKATINGVAVEGTPDEIAAFVKLASRAESLAERAGLGPQRPRPFDPRSRESQEAVKRLQELMAEIPNVNITPIGRICTGGMRFC